MDSQADIDRFYRQKGIQAPRGQAGSDVFCLQRTSPLGTLRLDAQATPTTILVGPDGDALGAYVGVAGWEQPAMACRPAGPLYRARSEPEPVNGKPWSSRHAEVLLCIQSEMGLS